jgi:hypothetical protein
MSLEPHRIFVASKRNKRWRVTDSLTEVRDAASSSLGQGFVVIGNAKRQAKIDKQYIDEILIESGSQPKAVGDYFRAMTHIRSARSAT